MIDSFIRLLFFTGVVCPLKKQSVHLPSPDSYCYFLACSTFPWVLQRRIRYFVLQFCFVWFGNVLIFVQLLKSKSGKMSTNSYRRLILLKEGLIYLTESTFLMFYLKNKTKKAIRRLPRSNVKSAGDTGLEPTTPANHSTSFNVLNITEIYPSLSESHP